MTHKPQPLVPLGRFMDPAINRTFSAVLPRGAVTHFLCRPRLEHANYS